MATAAVGFQNATDIVFDMNAVTTAATELFNFTATRPGKVIGVTVIAKATQAGGAIDLLVGGNSVVAGIACAAANTVALATSIAVANQSFAIGTVITIAAKTVGTQGLIIVHTEPTPYANQATITGV
jgi:hypothetical protein